MRIFATFKFDAAHALLGIEGEHKCKNLHGHTYELKVEIKENTTEEADWVMDFADLKAIVNREVIHFLDHTDLNTIMYMPTCENLVEYICWRLEGSFSGKSFRVTLTEGGGCGAISRWCV